MPNTEPSVLLTGAAGFIGSHVAEALLARGTPVVGVDNLDPFYDVSIKRRNLADVAAAVDRAPSGARFINEDADITDADAVRRVFEKHKPGSVIHLAAKAGVRPSLVDPVGYGRANVLGTQVLLSEAHRAGCARFVMASSSSVYGNQEKTPFSETDAVNEPISPYAATKRACELIAHTHHHLTGMPTACLRFFTVFGPRQRPDLAIAHFLARIGSGERITMFGDGASRRDYTYVDDIVAGVLASHDNIARFGYRIWNLGNSEPVSLADMISTIERVVGRSADIERKPMQPGDVEQTYADLARSREELGYQPTTPFEEGVRRQWGCMQTRDPA